MSTQSINEATGEVVVLLDETEARDLTAKIKAYAGSLWQLLLKAHDGQAWRAMNYTSWSAYLSGEFDISRSRGYQLIAHAQAVHELAGSAGVEVSTMVDTFGERDTRGLDLDAAKAAITEVVMDLPPEATTADRLAAVEATVDKLKAAAKAATRTPVPPTMAQDAAGANDADGKPNPPAADSDATPAAEPDRAADPDPVPVSPETHRAAQRAETSRLIARHRPLLGMNVDDAIEAADPEQLADLRAFTDSLADLVDELTHGLDRASTLRSAS